MRFLSTSSLSVGRKGQWGEGQPRQRGSHRAARGVLTFHHGVVGELLGVTHVTPPLPLQLQEDGDRTVDLGLVVGGRAEDDGILWAGKMDMGSCSSLEPGTGLPHPAGQPAGSRHGRMPPPRLYLLVHVSGGEVPEGLPAILVILIETHLDVIWGKKQSWQCQSPCPSRAAGTRNPGHPGAPCLSCHSLSGRFQLDGMAFTFLNFIAQQVDLISSPH